jgi:predicted NBD/HSP70 family sugar kinase
MVQQVAGTAASLHGASATQMRRYNQRLLLQRLRRLGEASKADLARAAHLTNTAVGDIVRELCELGLVRVIGKKHDGARGQPATMLALDPDGAYAIGVRLDRGRIESLLCDLGGRVLATRLHDGLLPSPAEALDLVRRDVADLANVVPSGRRDRIAGVGLARPWNLESWHAELDLPDGAFAAWDGVPFAEQLAQACGYPVSQENDGTAAAIAELFQGIGRTLDDFLYVFIGPAIGGGVVLGGQSVKGPKSNAGDIAVIPVPPSQLDSAPKQGDRPQLLLGRASLNVLMRHLRFHGVAVQGLRDLDAAAGRVPGAVLDWTRDAAEALAWPLLSASALLDLPTVVIDSDLDGPWIDPLLTHLAASMQRSCAEAREPPELRRGSFGQAAGALGAATLPLFLNFGPGALGSGAGGFGALGTGYALVA